MDYKAMISARRREATYLRESRGQHTLATEFEEDADAIEALLAERDAAVVAHGRWKRNHQCQLYCSRCLEYQDPAIEKPYCSNCGAKMDKEVRNV